jgi:Lipid A 3-O-deacylase (PagL)
VIAASAPPAVVATCDAAPSAVHGDWALVRRGEVGPVFELRLRTLASADCQAAASEPPPRAREDEWQVGAGYAWSIDLLQGEGGRRYVPVTLSWARDLTRDAGPGWLRGRLMWGIEAMPMYWQSSPTSTVGVAVSPLVWRWRFTPRRRAAAFAELAFGGLITADPVPEGTESTNFLTHGAFGLRWHPARRVALTTAYRFQHISNGNQLTTNPGVNAHVLWLGLSVVR